MAQGPRPLLAPHAMGPQQANEELFLQQALADSSCFVL